MKWILIALVIPGLYAQELDTGIQEAMADSGIEALGVAVISEYKLTWAKGYGKTISGESISPRATFYADDLSMPLTAMAALRAVQDGNLLLTQDINKALLYWKVPENKKTRHRKVTLRNLLEHSSGLRGTTLDEAQVERVPGRLVEINALGYDIIRLALQDKYKDPFAEVVHKMVFTPIGMKASKYDQESNHFITTTLDMSKWLISLEKAISGISERLLQTKSAVQMVTPRIDDEHGIGFLTSRNAVGEKEPNGTWFMAAGPSSLVIGNGDGDGVVILSDGKGDLFPVLQKVALAQGWTDKRHIE